MPETQRGDVAWHAAPEYVRLLIPRPHRDAYRAAITTRPLELVLRDLATDSALFRAPGAWTPRGTAAFDAFGPSGDADRGTVARLYGARRAQVARGARLDKDRVTEAWTLVSPYPSPTLGRLEEGTLLLVLRMP